MSPLARKNMHIQEEKAPRETHPLLRRLCMALVLVILFPVSLRAHAPLMVTNVAYRTFLIGWRGDLGTAFTIDHASKQYLVTARHVVKGIESGNVIKLFHEGKWKDLTVNVVGIGKGEYIDVAVLACSMRLSPSFPLVASKEKLQGGQAVSFFGYPFGWGGGGERINRGFPLPIMKAGIISVLDSETVPYLYLDAHGNKGFSGGPVVFIPNGQPGNRFHVAGVISFYPYPPKLPPELPPLWEPLVNREGKPVTDSTGEPIGYIRENPGIVAAVPIRHVVELIDANPIGVPLPAE